MEYRFKSKDFKKCFDFAIKYHLDPKKTSSGRTSGQTRGLGEIIDSFLGGKLVEIAVEKILKRLQPRKDYELNFKIIKTSKAKNQPDIIGIKQDKIPRNPNLFIEIKRTFERDRWVGLTEEQFRTMKGKAKNLTRINVIGVSIAYDGTKDQKEKDLLGSYMNRLIGGELFSGFGQTHKFKAKIDYVISGNDLVKYGVSFKKGGFFFETKIFKIASEKTENKIKKGLKGFEKVKEIYNSRIPPYVPSRTLKLGQNNKIKYPLPKLFFPLKLKGRVVLYRKKNKDSERRYLLCKTPVKIFSDKLGEFDLKKNRCYEYNISTVGRNPVLNRNNIWIAKTKVSFLYKKGLLSKPGESLKKIADTI